MQFTTDKKHKCYSPVTDMVCLHK